jgi:hypothetical protein
VRPRISGDAPGSNVRRSAGIDQPAIMILRKLEAPFHTEKALSH